MGLNLYTNIWWTNLARIR